VLTQTDADTEIELETHAPTTGPQGTLKMARLPYVDDEHAGPPELVAAIRQRRGGRLALLDRMLLHSTPIAEGWGPLMGRVRNDLALPARLRELAMCAVAAVNAAEYEWFHHAPLFLAAGGTDAQLAAMRRLPDQTESALAETVFDATDRALLRLAFESTRHVAVQASTLAAARAVLPDDTQLFEFVFVVAAYNMVSRVLVALDVRPEDGPGH
jgi:alkylhydroperoxidase family enzyme